MGMLYADIGRRADAETLLQRAYAGFDVALRPDHSYTRSAAAELEKFHSRPEGNRHGLKAIKAQLKARFRRLGRSDD